MKIINYYMEHSKSKTLLCGALGFMEFMNKPLKALYLTIPTIAYILALFIQDWLMCNLIPKVIQPVYELCVNILLIVIFVLLLIAVVVSVGRNLYNRETALFVEAFQNLREYQHQGDLKIYLMYKQTRNGITVRKIYSHKTKEEWNERSGSILQKFNEHFERGESFQYAKGNSLIIIMHTADGIEKPIKEEWHDSVLDKDLEEM